MQNPVCKVFIRLIQSRGSVGVTMVQYNKTLHNRTLIPPTKILKKNTQIKNGCALKHCQLVLERLKPIHFTLNGKVCRGRSSHLRCSAKKGVLRNFWKFTGKRLCQSIFFTGEKTFFNLFTCVSYSMKCFCFLAFLTLTWFH